MAKGKKGRQSGKLRIGDDWNAITIIALSQSNPLKAIAEFVENSIDARAGQITITRGREKGSQYLKILDDGEGIPKDSQGRPDFKFVATHICDSIKRKLKREGVEGIQGEFGIGLLSFWTVGEELFLTSAGDDGRAYQMRMSKGEPGYEVQPVRRLFPDSGTELKIWPLLSGLRQISGEKIQSYLASELRDRIRASGVEIEVVDRVSRKSFKVEPRAFSGRRLRTLPEVSTPLGDIYCEIYLADPQADGQVGLYRRGTRVLPDLSELEEFSASPWTSDYLEGIVDVPFLQLTPGTRSGIVRDAAYWQMARSLEPVAEELARHIEAQQRAEEEQASRQILRKIQKAFREAFLTLPPEEYDWFNVALSRRKSPAAGNGDGAEEAEEPEGVTLPSDFPDGEPEEPQKKFFEFPGPLYSVQISPASSVVEVGGSRTLRAICRDRSRRLVDEELEFRWALVDDEGWLEPDDSEIVQFLAPDEPCLARIELSVRQGDIECTAEAICTVAQQLPQPGRSQSSGKGLPSYTFERAPGKLWRSRYDTDQNLIVINSGHRDFVYSARTKKLKLRYITRLYAKEMICRNFPGAPPGELLERLIELTLHAEENL